MTQFNISFGKILWKYPNFQWGTETIPAISILLGQVYQSENKTLIHTWVHKMCGNGLESSRVLFLTWRSQKRLLLYHFLNENWQVHVLAWASSALYDQIPLQRARASFMITTLLKTSYSFLDLSLDSFSVPTNIQCLLISLELVQICLVPFFNFIGIFIIWSSTWVFLVEVKIV